MNRSKNIMLHQWDHGWQHPVHLQNLYCPSYTRGNYYKPIEDGRWATVPIPTPVWWMDWPSRHSILRLYPPPSISARYLLWPYLLLLVSLAPLHFSRMTSPVRMRPSAATELTKQNFFTPASRAALTMLAVPSTLILKVFAYRPVKRKHKSGAMIYFINPAWLPPGQQRPVCRRKQVEVKDWYTGNAVRWWSVFTWYPFASNWRMFPQSKSPGNRRLPKSWSQIMNDCKQCYLLE